ncbi:MULTISPECIES: DUF1329 domain-containing protein [unclassified Pseudomonas]|uniref:DUF1329 domain-containing protein n=1 Tax=unclassified Pseudomonas TaxID=196821 RepID=UPI0002A2D211|nr:MULTISPECIES: DUF1329 domain-containing protein [unclassified Pseudomonas]MBB1604992.1 outer membrane lipoprotein-sorting protein [Pseudomonas sp. UMC76]MBB1640429.1 outer membrane lipoprotein-sorting protein [Pseudomonas sp. UME83]NTX88477.1 DUF1329 domain-containing protein [Pseudomonas sp. UMA643]NTY19801.1 DUF1329 domain-containing protein [Pseudomonas sp. UMC3103]NTY26454.1 DUF1329 domain-containing protein [Pseudomonas sp. UMA603]
MQHKLLLKAGCLSLGLLAGQVMAAVSADQVARLGADLTPMGAEKAGNADGSIPAWTGGLATNAGALDAAGFLADPYAGEKPLFTITAQNAEQYKAKLTPGQLAMFKRFPDSYRIPVYPSHRSAAYPAEVLAAVKANAGATHLAEGGNGLENFKVSIPFPIPQNGLEAIWNHVTRYRGKTMLRTTAQMNPQSNGDYTISYMKEQFAFPFGLKDYDPAKMDNILYYFRQEILSPPRRAGSVMLVLETIDQVKEPRMAWMYNAGQRRVRRAPQVAYDSPGAEGMRTYDDFDMFNGSPDRYDWKLLGKQELYIPYNSFALDSPKAKYADIVKPGHLNPDYTRYELHRVWHVEATLKPGQRHVYSKRDLYIDEDSWQIAEADAYDGRGNLWRVSEGHARPFYDQQFTWLTAETHYDVVSGRYTVSGLRNEEKGAYRFDLESTSNDFTPSALRATGIR